MADDHDHHRGDGSGRDTAKSPERFSEALRDLDGTAYTDEIATHVGCHERTANRGLRTLEDEGAITSRETDEGGL